MPKLKRKKQLKKPSKKRIRTRTRTKTVRKIVSKKQKKKQIVLTSQPRSELKFSIFKNLALKISVILVIICLNWAGLSAIFSTVAYLNDTENSPNNNFTAGILDFYLSSPTANFIPVEIDSNMKPGDTVTREIGIIQAINTNQFKYKIETVQVGGDSNFCNALNLEAKLEGVTKYSDGLMNLNIDPPIVIGDDGEDDWLFTVTLPATSTEFTAGEICQIKFVFSGSQTRNDLPFGQGFSDTEEILSSFTATLQKIVINKVYYDVDSNHGNENDNEWIELYNSNEVPIDISNWQICDNNDCDVISTTSNLISAHGFALITNKNTTWNYWGIPAGILKINLDSPIGNGLHNDADMLILKNSQGNIIDQMNWGVPTTTWPNYNSNIWDPGVADVAEGHMLARVPAGVDTDTTADWHDLGLPQVQVIWPNGGEVLYVGGTYTLQWLATNPNGTNTALSIDIYYSADSGSTWANIVTGTENDGAYNWTIPLFINGYYIVSHHARIKVVATGPENFMVQAWDMSDADFCPPIDYSLITDEEKAQVDQLLAAGILTEEDIINREVSNLPMVDSGATLEVTGLDLGETAVTTDAIATITPEETPGDDEVTTTVEDTATTTAEDATTTIEDATTTITTDTSTITEDTGTTTNTVDENNSQVVNEQPEQPAIEQQPVVTPDDSSGGNNSNPGDTGSGDSGSGTSDNGDSGGTPSE